VTHPNMARGVPPFINAQKRVEFSKEKVCFDLEMMGFLLPYDLGVMKIVLMVSRGGDTSQSECDTWEGAYDTCDSACDTYRGAYVTL
jgi:hypothetical protein